MELLRVSPFPIQLPITVETTGIEYEVSVLDLVDHSVSKQTVVAETGLIALVTLPSDRDGNYTVSWGNEEEDVSVIRPYVDANTKATTASEIADYKKHEQIARAIIDSVVTSGFYYRKHILQTSGQGSDYIPLWVNARKIFSVSENNKTIYDVDSIEEYPRKFEIVKNRTAIAESYAGGINRIEGAPLILPFAPSDSLDLSYSYRGFPNTFDYTFVLGVGYKNLPTDLVLAAEMLIDDLMCGKLEYFKRYVSSYDTDQFSIKLNDKIAFEGTGNILVDKILSNYTNSITTLGVL
jgi:hypothetical protein